MTFLVPQGLPKKEVRLGRRTQSGPFRGVFVLLVGSEPALRGDDQHAGRIVGAIFAPFRPALVRAAEVFVQQELIECHLDLGLPEQLAQPADGAGVLGVFVAVANEDLVQHLAANWGILESGRRIHNESTWKELFTTKILHRSRCRIFVVQLPDSPPDSPVVVIFTRIKRVRR